MAGKEFYYILQLMACTNHNFPVTAREQNIHEIDLEKGPLYVVLIYIYVAGLSAKVEVSLM